MATGISPSATILAGFVTKDVKQFLSLAVQNYSRLAPPYMAAMEQALQTAWQEAEELFAQAGRQIEALTDGQLAAHGLTGATLALKLEAVQSAIGQANEVLGAPSPPAESFWKKFRKKFKWTADGIDNVLDSLEPLVPRIGLIKEIKHHIGWIADAPEEEGAAGPPSGTSAGQKAQPASRRHGKPGNYPL